jgi:hypothetical protein
LEADPGANLEAQQVREIADRSIGGAFHTRAGLSRDHAAAGNLKGLTMYKALNGAIIALSVVGGMLAIQAPVNAQGFGISLDVGNVAFGYRDGYWDRDHHWHQWRNQDEARYYRNAPGNRYNDYRHDRDSNQGWQDISFNVNDVAFGYQDGYWDHGHRWHQWRNDQEMRYYRNAPGNQYNDYRHDRDSNQGWQEISFNVNDVAYAYQDGYWDQRRRWHQWRSEQERHYYRTVRGNQYSDYRHDRGGNAGWPGLSINVNDVAFGYQDGYWDRSHQWHQWRNDQEMRDYRKAGGNRYNDYRHDRDNDQGWHQ